jgi:HSP20 family protein
MRNLLPVFGGSRLLSRDPDIDNRIRRWFEEPLFRWSADTVAWAPPVELVEKEDAFLLTAELPGMKVEDVDISIEDNVLTLTGEKHREEEVKEDKYYVYEREYGSFTRSLLLPARVLPDKVKAEFEGGVLHVHIPKTTEARGRKIPIEMKKK